MKSIAFFNTRAGVGKSTLIYHLAWIYAEKGIPVLAVDLDPQVTLTTMFLDETKIGDIWDQRYQSSNITDYQKTIFDASDTNNRYQPELVDRNLYLLPGDQRFLGLESVMARSWSAFDFEEEDYRTITALDVLIKKVAKMCKAELILIDMSPDLRALNQSVLIAADTVSIPLASDMYSLHALEHLAPALQDWRSVWQKQLLKAPEILQHELPQGNINVAGYTVHLHGVQNGFDQGWIDRIPGAFRRSVLQEELIQAPKLEDDPFNLALLPHNLSLMPMALRVKKPMFHLKPSDGAFGAQVDAVKKCLADYSRLADTIAKKADFQL